MSDDYLWDGRRRPILTSSGSSDARPAADRTARARPRGSSDLVTCGRCAEPRRTSRLVLSLRFARSGARWQPRRSLLMIGLTWHTTRSARVVGGGRIWTASHASGRACLPATGRIAVGQTLATDEESRARLDVSTIGQVTVDPNTRVRLVERAKAVTNWRSSAARCTPSSPHLPASSSSTRRRRRRPILVASTRCTSTRTAPGCSAWTAGWVAFEYDGRESFVPAGASSRTDPRSGPGHAAVRRYGEGVSRRARRFRLRPKSRGEERDAALVLEHARRPTR